MEPDIEYGKAAQRLRTQSDAQLEPEAVEQIGDWLGCLAMLDPADRGGDECGWCGSNHALAIARAVNGGRR